MIEEAYCSYEVSKILKEKGFDGECLRFYTTHNKHLWLYQHYHDFDIKDKIESPTHQMAMAYLRDKDIYICPKHCCFCGSKPKDKPYYLWEPRILRLPGNNIIYPQPVDMCDHYDSYEDAVEAALLYCLKNLI